MTNESPDSNSWANDIRQRFPDWQTDASIERWPVVKNKLCIGQEISGRVVARAPFGVWLDIDCSWPALLLVPNMKHGREKRIGFDEYPAIGSLVDGRINAIGDGGEIGVTQRIPDDMIKGETR